MKLDNVLYAAAGAVLLTSVGISSHLSKDEVTFTVKDKERIVKNEDSYYLVFTDKSVFKNEDSWWQLKFDSSELQNQLVRGETFTCSKNFWRVPFLSMYENLIDCEKEK